MKANALKISNYGNIFYHTQEHNIEKYIVLLLTLNIRHIVGIRDRHRVDSVSYVDRCYRVPWSGDCYDRKNSAMRTHAQS